MKAFGYVRVSTDRQAEQGVSLEAQEAKIHAMATVQGAKLLDVTNVSGPLPAEFMIKDAILGHGTLTSSKNESTWSRSARLCDVTVR
jgi:Resolvase, N terminal domain